MSESQNTVRNFCIIAHIDHGKTTLTDRILELTSQSHHKDLREKDRLTDILEIEQERGITIKLQPATMQWKGHTLNLIDTPGHVDFTYEVSRSLKACEGALLLIDVTQGIQAQTISNLLLAMEADLVIIPVINKVDLDPQLVPERLKEIKDILGFKEDEVILASGKTGLGIDTILDTVIEKVPAPEIPNKTSLSALIFDSFYDEHKGIVAAIRVIDGKITNASQLHLLNTTTEFTPKEIGIFTPELVPSQELAAGSVGYIATGIKDIRKVGIGDTISDKKDADAIPGYQRPVPKVFASIFPENQEDYIDLKESIGKLSLNDAALQISDDYSPLLGQGFRVGFLGLLHLEITKERLEREFAVRTVVTIPSVEYKAVLKTGEQISVKSAYDLPNISTIESLSEPFIKGEILTPSSHISSLYETVIRFRGTILNTRDLYSSQFSSYNYVVLDIEMPFAELLKGFFNTLKSVSHGFASFQYGDISYRETKLIRIDILVNKEIVPPLSFLDIPERAVERASSMLNTLKKTIPPHVFSIPLQATVGGKIIAREDVSAFRKNVTGKLYGGDITRKKKLLENQKKKKKEMQIAGKVRIPSETFIKIINS
ncbi:MAG: translation elongation factor 4 [Candidatus Dojkabacteria bacterium]|nr:MAG: translation elongation factor 4 [Candidatus Dojkabacteria bacterium]